jgi:hypothetical protein
MSDEERNLNSSAFAQKGVVQRQPHEGQRKRSGLDLRHGASRDLYKEQWLKLLDMSGNIRAFIVANEAQSKTKN